MGVRAARRAFFSYTTEPEGSYSIHRVFIRFLEVNRMDMDQAEKPKAAAFLTDYILLRIYVAKYVLAGYAETYAPLLDLFRGFEKVEKKFSLFMERETAPGHGAERKFLPPDLRKRYDERGMRKTIELFDNIAGRYEEREDTPERVMKCIVDECLSTIAIRNEIIFIGAVLLVFYQRNERVHQVPEPFLQRPDSAGDSRKNKSAHDGRRNAQ